MHAVRLTLALLLIPLTAACAALAPAQGSTAPIPGTAVVRALDATVALTAEDGRVFCTGSFVGEVVLTAAHCVDDIEPPEGVRIELRDGRSFNAIVIAIDTETDGAVLGATEVIGPHASVQLAPYDPAPGDKVIVVGHPLGFRWFVTSGYSAGVQNPFHDGDYLLFSAPIMYGNSGGPVFNEFAEVVAVVSWMSVAPDGAAVPHMAGGVPLKNLRPLLNAN